MESECDMSAISLRHGRTFSNISKFESPVIKNKWTDVVDALRFAEGITKYTKQS